MLVNMSVSLNRLYVTQHLICKISLVSGLPSIAQLVNHLPAMQKTGVRFLGWEDPLERKWQPTPVFLPGEPHGQRSLTGYSPGDRKSQTQLSD